MTNGFNFFIIFFLVFFNQLSKFLFFCQTVLFFTSNECFSHFNFQQLSTLKHKSFCFVFTSSFKNNIEKENIRKNLFHSISNTKVRFTLFNFFFGARHENPKINKRGGGGPNNSGRGGWIFFQKKYAGEGAFLRDLRVNIS